MPSEISKCHYTIPSGCVTTTVDVLEKFAKNNTIIDCLTTKSISKEPKAGYREPIFASLGDGSFINAAGLQNPGVEEFATNLEKIKNPKNKFIIASIVGSNVQDNVYVAERLKKLVNAYEINISCPHADGHGMAVGQDFELVEKITREVKKIGLPVFVKLSPSISVDDTMDAILKANADGVVAINTWGPEEYCFDGSPVLSNKVGGVSGSRIKNEGLRVVREIRNKTSLLPIIGMGGIRTAADIIEYRKAGANVIGIGSALVGMNTKEVIKYFETIDQDVKNGTNNAESLLKDNKNMEYKKIWVTKNERLASDLFTLEFNKSIKINPGQFIMLRIPNKGEKPFSVYSDNPFKVLIESKGCFTNELSKLNTGDELYYRGSYGQSLDIKGKKLLLVGGGTGIAALPLFEKENECFYVVGARDKDHLPNEFQKSNRNKIIYTDNGSAGVHGLVTRDLSEIIKRIRPDIILNCGPKPMIYAALDIESRFLNLKDIYSSIERTTKCSVGVCGACADPTSGLRPCVDGPFTN